MSGGRRYVVHRLFPKLCTKRVSSRRCAAAAPGCTSANTEQRTTPVCPRSDESGPGCLLDPVGQFGDLVIGGAPLGHQSPDLAVGVDDGGVVPAAEQLADLR